MPQQLKSQSFRSSSSAAMPKQPRTSRTSSGAPSSMPPCVANALRNVMSRARSKSPCVANAMRNVMSTARPGHVLHPCNIMCLARSKVRSKFTMPRAALAKGVATCALSPTPQSCARKHPSLTVYSAQGEPHSFCALLYATSRLYTTRHAKTDRHPRPCGMQQPASEPARSTCVPEGAASDSPEHKASG